MSRTWQTELIYLKVKEQLQVMKSPPLESKTKANTASNTKAAPRQESNN